MMSQALCSLPAASTAALWLALLGFSSRLERCKGLPTPPSVLGAIPKERFLCLGGESVWFVLLVISALGVILPFKKG